ncbi:MAG: tRNA pseudouridine(55) synthase TruB [Coriobacteriia bacterium]|nr:tRNA pseudouridine(55) synthase TruB [Coriobacteriia bacterium]
MRSRRGATDLAGVICLDKPSGITSHDVVNTLRSATGERRVGHAGTLDPMATGLLLVLIGRATRLEQYLVGHDKRYEARIVFGSATDTLDADGEVTSRSDVPADLMSESRAEAILASFLGPGKQMPPAYSAIKRNGVAAHKLARAGEVPDLSPREIVVHEAALTDIDPDGRSWTVSFLVSKGTYIRSLARDIGLSAGTVAHLGALRRTSIGTVNVADAVTLDAVVSAAGSGSLESVMTDPVPLLDMPALEIDPAAIADGRKVPAADMDVADGCRVALVTDDMLLGVYRRQGSALVPETVLVPGVDR